MPSRRAARSITTDAVDFPSGTVLLAARPAAKGILTAKSESARPASMEGCDAIGRRRCGATADDEFPSRPGQGYSIRMKLVFLYGPAASGKLTIAREIAKLTGFAVFHNHLIVDAVLAVFPFGSEPFVRLREQFWMATFAEAAAQGRSLVFTFAPEASVSADFPQRVVALVGGGRRRGHVRQAGRFHCRAGAKDRQSQPKRIRQAEVGGAAAGAAATVPGEPCGHARAAARRRHRGRWARRKRPGISSSSSACRPSRAGSG